MPESPIEWRCRERRWLCAPEGPALIMGILNVTPDSFSDGGRFIDRDRAIAHGIRLAREGADLIDVGGESTRPGAAPVAAEEERARVTPVIEALARAVSVPLSIDTRKADVAESALEAGACLVNDVSALTADPRMAAVVRAAGAGAILMHMRGEPRTMQADPRYDDAARDVRDYLARRLETLAREGLAPETLAVDPGIGFGKTTAHNLRLLTHLDELRTLGRPVVVGLSRKRFLGRLTEREVADRLAGSLGALAYSLLRGAHVARVHDVAASRDVARVVQALRQEERGVWTD